MQTVAILGCRNSGLYDYLTNFKTEGTVKSVNQFIYKLEWFQHSPQSILDQYGPAIDSSALTIFEVNTDSEGFLPVLLNANIVKGRQLIVLSAYDETKEVVNEYPREPKTILLKNTTRLHDIIVEVLQNPKKTAIFIDE